MDWKRVEHEYKSVCPVRSHSASRPHRYVIQMNATIQTKLTRVGTPQNTLYIADVCSRLLHLLPHMHHRSMHLKRVLPPRSQLFHFFPSDPQSCTTETLLSYDIKDTPIY